MAHCLVLEYWLIGIFPAVPQCPFCSIGLEDIHHCLFMCTRVKEVWTELGLLEIISDAVGQDRSGSITVEVFSRIKTAREDLPTAEFIMVAAWYLWWQRHQHVKGEAIQTADRAATSIRVLATNFI